MIRRKRTYTIAGTIIGVVAAFFVFVVPFLFMFLESVKDKKESNMLSFTLPTSWHFENYVEVIRNSNYQLLRAFKNSAIITIGAVLMLVVVCSMAGYFIQRRGDKLAALPATISPSA